MRWLEPTASTELSEDRVGECGRSMKRDTDGKNTKPNQERL